MKKSFGFQKNTKLSCSGLTLIEVLISMGILATVLSGIVVAFISGMVLIESAKNTIIAANNVASLMEEIRSSAFVNLVDNYDQVTFILNDIPLSKGVVYVDDSNSELIKVTITVSWRQRGNRIIGGDTNLNGQLDAGEKSDSDGILSSPVKIVTLISNGS